MTDEIVSRIERDAGVPGLAGVLAERLPPTDLQSLLLAVARRRAASMTSTDVLRRYEADRFVRPAPHDPARIDEFAATAFAALPPGFERVELSPVCPLGTSSVLGGIGQDRVVTTVRGSEVVSDATNVLALECAVRRRRERSTPVRLCTSHRVLRAPPVAPPLLQHFRLFSLVTACRAREADAALAEQLELYERLFAAVGTEPPHVDQLPRKPAYYDGPTFGISVAGTELVEGGFVDWTQGLLGDRKERLLISGLGLELLALVAGV